ncbi:hypothetical protein Mapa_015782 [Marchantia paleacea]|nr:hypothetical protein Mapa_015782 [Marchantia paleacea]
MQAVETERYRIQWRETFTAGVGRGAPETRFKDSEIMPLMCRFCRGPTSSSTKSSEKFQPKET